MEINSASSSPNPNSQSLNQEIDPTTIIDAVPVSIVSPLSTKKRSKRSKKETKSAEEEAAVSPPPSVEKSKKKKSKRSKSEGSRKVHTMESLYLEPINEENVAVSAEASVRTGDQILSDTTQTLEMFK
jgi:hypothetical protein